MSELLPSELARLILGYMESRGYTKTAEVMLDELPELAEINQRRKKGRKVNLRVGEYNLNDFLDDYYSTKDLIIDYMEKWPVTFAALKKIQSLTDHMKIILEMALKSKTYQYYPKNQYRPQSIFPRSKQMTLPLMLPQNITVSIGDEAEPDCISGKKYSTDATPESSLPGSTKRPTSPSPKEVISLEKSPEMGSSTPEKTRQKKKGSMRKKTQPSPKAISKTLTPEGDDKMEKLLKNLIENKALHQKIAENINKSLYPSIDEPVGLKQSLNSDSGIQSKQESDSGTQQELNFNTSLGGSLDLLVDGDISVGSKGSLPDNVISNLSLQVTTDPMVESILASIVCRTPPPSSSNRPLFTPVPSLSPSQSSHLSLSCSAFGSFPPCESIPDGISQPVNQISSNFNLEQRLGNNEEETAKSSLDNINLETRKEVTSSSFSLPFTSAATKSLGAGPIERDFQNASSNQTDNLCTSSIDNESTLQETASGHMQDDNFTDSHAEDLVEMNSEIPLTSGTELDVGNMMKSTSYADPDHSTNMAPEMAKLLFSKGIETSQDVSNKSENVGLATMKELLNEAIDGPKFSPKTSHLTCLDTSSRKLSDGQTNLGTPDIIPEIKENGNPGGASNLTNHETMLNTTDAQQHKSDPLTYFIPGTTSQNISPLHPAPVIPIPVTCSNDGFLNTKYFSGTPDHPNNYTFTELTPLPPVMERQDECHIKLINDCISDAAACKTSDAVSTQESSIDSQVLPSLAPVQFSLNSTSNAPLISPSLERVQSPPEVVSEEYLDSTILKVSGPQDTAVVIVQMPYQDCNLPPILPKLPTVMSTDQGFEKKKTQNKRRSQKQPRARQENLWKMNRRKQAKLSPKSSVKKKTEEESPYRLQSSCRLNELIVEALENSKKVQSIENSNAEEDSNSSSLKKLETSVTGEKSEIEMSCDNFSTHTNEKNEVANACSESNFCLKNEDNNKPSEHNTVTEIHKELSCEKKGEQSLELSPTSAIPWPTESLKVNSTSSSLMDESDNAIFIDENVNMENLVDELELKNIDNLSIVKKSVSHANETKPKQIGIAFSSESKDTKSSIKTHSPGLKSLLSFSKKFTLKSNLCKNVNSPSSNAKISVYKGSLSTPRNKRNHVRVLDFNTPQKGFSLRKTSSKAKASLKFSPPLAVKLKSSRQKSNASSSQKKLSLQKPSSLNVIPEDPKEGCSHFVDSTVGNFLLEKEGKGYASKIQPCVSEKTSPVAPQVDETSLVGVEEDLFLSDDETPLVILSNVDSGENGIVPKSKKDTFSLQTPGKETYSALCFEAATPTPNLLKNSSDALHPSELNTPILPHSSSTHDSSSLLKSYPKGPYSDSPREIYYQPSERGLNESLPYSPLQDDIESVLIKTAQKTEEEMRQFQPQQYPGSSEVKIVEEGSEVITSDSTEQKEMISKPIFDDLLKNRPKYKLRKLNNKELGEVIEQEMELFKQMKSLSDQNTDSYAVKDSILEMEKSSKNAHHEDSDESTSTMDIKNHSGITFEAFRCQVEVLKTFTVAILRHSHIKSAQDMLKSILSLFERAKNQNSTFTEKNIIDLLLGLVNFYATPEIVDKLRNRTFYPTKHIEDIGIENKSSSSGCNNSQPNVSSTKSKTNEKPNSKEIKSKAKKSEKSSKPKMVRKTRGSSATQKESIEEVTLIECEIEAKLINNLEAPCHQQRENSGGISSSNLSKESLNRKLSKNVSSPTKKSTLEVTSHGLASENLTNNELLPVNNPSKQSQRKLSTSEDCMRAVAFRGNSPYAKKAIKPAEDFGLVINVTHRKWEKEQLDCRKHPEKLKGLSYSSENSSDSFINILDDLPLQHSSSPNQTIDNHGEYSFIERQLAALDGSVVDSPNLRHQLENNSMDETYISAMFTPSYHPPEENVVGYSFKRGEKLLLDTPTKKSQRPLISFTPLPGTPEKAVEEICQTVVKDKLALVAFPSMTQQFSNEGSDKELSEKVKDVTQKFLLNKKQSLESELAQNENNHTNQSLLTSPLKEMEDDSDVSYKIETSIDADDTDALCTLSYSDTFELLALNLETSTKNKQIKKSTKQKDTTNAERKISRTTNQIEDKSEPRASSSKSEEVFHNLSNPSTSLRDSKESPEKHIETMKQERVSNKYDSLPLDNCENSYLLADHNLGVLRLSSSECEDSSDTPTGEMLSFGAKVISKDLIKGGSFELSESPKKMQQISLSNFPRLDNFAYFNEESIYSMPPTPGKDLFLGGKLKTTKSGGHEMQGEYLFHPLSSNLPDPVHAPNLANVSGNSNLQMKQETKLTKLPATLPPHKGINLSSPQKRLSDSPENSEILPTQRQGLRRSSRSNKGVLYKCYEAEKELSEILCGKRKRERPSVSKKMPPSKKKKETMESPDKKQNPSSVSSKKDLVPSKKRNQPTQKSTANSQSCKQMPSNELPLIKNKISPSFYTTRNTVNMKTEEKNLIAVSPPMEQIFHPASCSSPTKIPNKVTSDRELEKKIHAFTNLEKKEILDLLDFIHPPKT